VFPNAAGRAPHWRQHLCLAVVRLLGVSPCILELGWVHISSVFGADESPELSTVGLVDLL
jgi:hypothetical protein